jgi:diguanylate cyclase (GGDEF)-like protein
MEISAKPMLAALIRIVGIRDEHFALLTAHGCRLFARRDVLANELRRFLPQEPDESAQEGSQRERVETLIAGFVRMLATSPDARHGASVFGQTCEQLWGRSAGIARLSGLAECFVLHLQLEIAALAEPRELKEALGEALQKRVTLDWMMQLQNRGADDANADGARWYSTLSAISLALTSSPDRAHLFQSVCRICVDEGGFAHAWISSIHVSDHSLTLEAIAGDRHNPSLMRIPPDDKGPWALAARTSQLQVVDEDQLRGHPHPWAEALRRSRIRSVLITPLVFRDQTVGLLTLCTRARRHFDANTLGLVRAMSNEISHALERQSDLARSQDAESKLAYLVQHDLLTGLPNRQMMQERIAQLIAQAQTDGRITVLTLAIDGFHELNARLGHERGDTLLREVALRMSRITAPYGLVGRVGAARFVACSDRFDPVAGMVDELMAAMSEPIQCEDEAISLKCSLGVVLEGCAQSEASTLMRCSDLALIRAREDGGGLCRYYDQAMDQEIHRLHALRNDFAHALQHGGLELYYQPKIDLHDHRISGVEALIRWRRNDVLIMPAEFFPAIERTDLMRKLDWWVMREALRHSSIWMAQGKLIPVSVNLSAMTLRHDSFLPCIQALIMRHPIPDGHLELEVLESVSQKEAEEIIYKLERCREFGVSIALDDFGTGASSLVHLQQLPFDTIKIDQRFVRMLLEAPGNEAIIRSMTSFAHYTGRNLVVEGVESQPIWDRLKEIGCVSGQGYAISPPVPYAQLMNWMVEHEQRAQALKAA